MTNRTVTTMNPTNDAPLTRSPAAGAYAKSAGPDSPSEPHDAWRRDYTVFRRGTFWRYAPLVVSIAANGVLLFLLFGMPDPPPSWRELLDPAVTERDPRDCQDAFGDDLDRTIACIRRRYFAREDRYLAIEPEQAVAEVLCTLGRCTSQNTSGPFVEACANVGPHSLERPPGQPSDLFTMGYTTRDHSSDIRRWFEWADARARPGRPLDSELYPWQEPNSEYCPEAVELQRYIAAHAYEIQGRKVEARKKLRAR